MKSHLVDMAKTPEEVKEESSPSSLLNVSKYPWGMSIRLGQDELDKLNIDAEDFEIDGVYHIHALVKCTSKSSDESVTGERNCVELQITHLAGMESEDEEDEVEEKSDLPSLKNHGYLRQK